MSNHDPESIGRGLLAVREAHRYCTVKDHGGHDFPACPVLAEFRRMVGRPEFRIDTTVRPGPNFDAWLATRKER